MKRCKNSFISLVHTYTRTMYLKHAIFMMTYDDFVIKLECVYAWSLIYKLNARFYVIPYEPQQHIFRVK